MATHDETQFFENAEDFFASDQPVVKEISLPELKKGKDGKVRKMRIQSMSGPEKAALDARRWDPRKSGGDPERFRATWFEEDRPAEMISLSVRRADGTRVFSNADAKRLKGVNPKTFARLYAAAQEVNGEDTQELKLSGKDDSTIQESDSGSESRTPTDIGQYVASSEG